MGCKTNFYANVSNLHDEVTGSCHYVTVTLPTRDNEKVRFIVDCGLFQEKCNSHLNDKLPFFPNKLDFILITHTHIDHIGRIPLLYKNRFNKTAYISDIAKPFMRDALNNTAMIFKQNKTRNNENSAILYDESHVELTMKNTTSKEYNKSFYPHENIKVTFFENAHLLGASTILVEIFYENEKPINLLFSGDYAAQSNFRDVPDLPSYVYDLDLTLFTESTYGTTTTNDIEKRFETNILKAIDEGKSIFLPAFSMQRTQELLLVLKKMQLAGKIPLSIPIFSDGGLSIGYTQKFLKLSDTFKPEAQQFLPENFSYASKNLRNQIINDHNQKIIISSSGMCSYGPAVTYISNFLSNKNYLIHLNGYSSEGSLARQLFDAINEDEAIIKIQGVHKIKLCDIDYSFEFSSHAKKDELITFLNKFNNIKLLMISHGDPEVKDNFAKSCLKKVKAKDIAIQSSSNVFKIGPYGFIKSYSYKFI